MSTNRKAGTRTSPAASPSPPGKSASTTSLHHPPVAPATPEAPFSESVLDASVDEALAAVAGVPSERHDALVQAWIAHRNAAAIDTVARSDGAPATARKAARRALGVLKSRGIAIPERPSVVSLVSPRAFHFEARAIFPDGQGGQIWWIARISSTGGTEVVEIATHDRGGILEVNRGNLTHGNLRQLWQSWITRAGRVPFDVPVEYARWRIAEAREMTTKRGAILPLGLDGARELVGPSPAAPPPHPIFAEELVLPSEEEAVRARLQASMRLHEEPEFSSWMPEEPAASAFLQAIHERIVVLSDQERDDESIVGPIVNEVVEGAADAYFSDERKRLYERRLQDAALSLYRAGLMQRAIDALLVADAIKRAGIVSDRPSDLGFVRGMFIKHVAITQQRIAASSPRPNEEGERLQREAREAGGGSTPSAESAQAPDAGAAG